LILCQEGYFDVGIVLLKREFENKAGAEALQRRREVLKLLLIVKVHDSSLEVTLINAELSV
jgi:hypothetical protein